MKLRIKYCGGCNPIINRTQVLKEAIEILKQSIDVEIVEDQADIGLVIAGCHAACIDLAEIEDQAKNWAVVSGNLADSREYPTHQLPEIIAQKILIKL